MGFEPTEACTSLVFKTSTFGRSVTPPGRINDWIEGQINIPGSDRSRNWAEFSTPKWRDWYKVRTSLMPDTGDEVIIQWLDGLNMASLLPAAGANALQQYSEGLPSALDSIKGALRLWESVRDNLDDFSVWLEETAVKLSEGADE